MAKPSREVQRYLTQGGPRKGFDCVTIRLIVAAYFSTLCWLLWESLYVTIVMVERSIH